MKCLSLFALVFWLALGGVACAKGPVMLIFHPGGFIYDKPMGSAAKAAASRGFTPRVVDYPLLNVPGAVRQSARLARRLDGQGRSVYAYGESAGGTLACLLAERGLVRGTAAQAPVSDIPRWIETTGNDPAKAEQVLRLTPESAERFSPDEHPTRRPILAEAPAEDAISAPTLPWARKQPLVKGLSVPGTHLDPTYLDSNMNLAMDYLAMRRKADSGHDPVGRITYQLLAPIAGRAARPSG